jgi:benzoate-CoA ligase
VAGTDLDRDEHRPCATGEARDPAFWLYSSGTTGKPKGIIHSHKDVACGGQVFAETLALAPGDRVFVTSKLFFAYALDHGLLDRSRTA